LPRHSEETRFCHALGFDANRFAMNRDRLYLLKPHFMDGDKGPYYCPHCAQLVGLMEFYPTLKGQLEVRWLDFPRPRAELVALLGDENQSCPVLVLAHAPSSSLAALPLRQARGRWFVEGAEEIATYLARVHGTGLPH
jgi:hypothetical protein